MSHVLVRVDQTELIGRATAAAAHQTGSRFNPAKAHVVPAGRGKLWAVRGYVVDSDTEGLPLRVGDEVPAVGATRSQGQPPKLLGVHLDAGLTLAPHRGITAAKAAAAFRHVGAAVRGLGVPCPRLAVRMRGWCTRRRCGRRRPKGTGRPSEEASTRRRA